MSWTSSVVGPWPSVQLVLYGSWSPSVKICITAQRSRNASVIVPELAEIGDNYEFVNQFRPLWSDPGCRMSISAMQRSSDFSWVAKKKDVWMIAPPSFILILSTYLEHDLIYSFQNVSAKSGSCAHFISKCAKLAQSALSPNLSHNDVTVDIRTKVKTHIVIFPVNHVQEHVVSIFLMCKKHFLNLQKVSCLRICSTTG